MDYNKEIDKENIEIFKRYAIRSPQGKRHKCVICEKPTSIDASYSIEGHKLICNKCFIEKFDYDSEKLREWQKEKD